jgi:hypothetical protein
MGGIKLGARFGKGVVKIFCHSNELGALPRKNESRLADDRSPVLLTFAPLPNPR